MFLPTLVLLAAMPPQPLSTYVDKNRVLLVFAPNAQDPRYLQQLQLFQHQQQDLRERDLVILPVLINPGPAPAPDTLRTLSSPAFDPQEQLATRNRFHIAPDEFAVILIGKDGGEKLTRHTPISVETLNRTIDAMPMRQDEMKRKR